MTVKSSTIARLFVGPRRRAAPLLLVTLFVLSSFAIAPAGASSVSAATPTAHVASAGTHDGLAPAMSHLLEQELHLPPVGASGLLSPSPSLTTFALSGTSSSPTSPRTASSPETSTSSNFDLTGSSCSHGSQSAQVAGSASTLESVTTSWYSIFNGTGGTTCSVASPSAFWWKYGETTALRSTDSGVTWSPVYMQSNVTHWQNSSDTAYGSITGSDPSIAAGGSTVLVGSYFLQACDIVGGLTCNSSLGGSLAPVGVSVARSTDGGLTFGANQQLYARPDLITYSIPGCTQFPQPSFIYYGNYTENPMVAYDPNSNVAVAAWDMLHMSFNTTACTYGFSNTSVMYMVSSDGGATWGTPQLLPSDGGSVAPAISFGPAPADNIYIVSTDEGVQNSTVQADGNFQFSFATWISTNNGTSFTAKSDAAPKLANFASSTYTSTNGPGYQPNYPDSFGVYTQPILTVDNWSGDAHAGYQYVVWNDNQSGSYGGYPGIAFIEKAPGALAWTTPVMISTPGTSATYFQPAVSVAPGGTIWVTYLVVNRANGNYRDYGVFSSDGGVTWSSQFPISDANSQPTDQQSLGSKTGLTATSTGAVPVWTDCRGTCANSNPASELFAANVHIVNVSANIGGVNATITTFGVTGAPLPLPLNQGWDVGSSHTISVPVWVPSLTNTSYVNSFQSWSGLSTSTNFTTTLSYTGLGSLVANYAAVPASWIAGNFTPYVPKASLKIDNQYSVPLHQIGTSNLSTYNFTVASGTTYALEAYAPGYQPLTAPSIPTTAHQTTLKNIALAKYTGTINGHVSLPSGIMPSAATVMVNNTQVTPDASGLFSLSVGWGWYWVRANVTGLTNFSQYVQVLANQSAPVSIVLNGGWIEGNVLTPTHLSASFRLAIDGILDPNITAGGTFNVTVRGGFHTLTATQSGYNLTVIRDINVVPGHATIVNVNLTNHGWIAGVIGPSAILTSPSTHLTISNHTAGGNFYGYSPTTGQFNVSLLGGYNWTLNVSSTGYISYQTVLYVSPGNQSGIPLQIELVKKTTGCTGSNCNNPQNNSTTPPTAANLPTALIVGIVVIVLVVAIALVVLLRRRGGGSSGSTIPSDETPAEGESIYGQAPPAETDDTSDSPAR